MKFKKVILPSGQIYLNAYMFEDDIKYRYIGIDFKFNTRYELSSVHVFSTGSMTHFSDFFSYLLTSFCHFVFIEWFFSQLFKQLTLKKQK